MVSIWKMYHFWLIIYYLQEKISIVFKKKYLKTFLSGEKIEGEMVP